MDPLKKSEVLLMQEDVLVYGFKHLGMPYFQEDDSGDARQLFTPSVGEAVLRFRCANERAYVTNIRKQTVQRLLESSSMQLGKFVTAQMDNIFANREENYMKFFRYLAFILDLTVFTHRYKRIQLMNPVFVEIDSMFDTFLSTEKGVPFWQNFLILCDTVLRNSSEHGRPTRHFRNPAVYWNPRHPNFNPNDPVLTWDPPIRNLPPDHPILKPDLHALMNKLRSDGKAPDRRAECTDEGDEHLNLGALNLGARSSNLNVQRSCLRAEGSDLGVQGSFLGAEGSNRGVQGSFLGADSSNLVVKRSKPGAEGSNLVVERSKPGAEGSNLVVEKSNPGAEGSNLVEKSNPGAEGSNLVVERSNPGADNVQTTSTNSEYSAENLNADPLNTTRDENSNRGAVSSTGAVNLSFGDENSNRTNEVSHPGAEDIDPDPFEVLIAAMQWDIYNIIENTDPQDPAFD